MTGTALKVAIGVFFVWLSAQMGTFVDEVLTRVKESVQASELLKIDSFVHVVSIGDEQRRQRPPRDQAEFDAIVRDWLTAQGGRDVAKDRWNEPYIYDRIPRDDPRDIYYRITSKGPDRLLGTADDIVIEREGESSRINRNPVDLAEHALERKQELDREIGKKLRDLVEKANTTSGPDPLAAKDPTAERSARELESATRELGRILGES
jgi:hypothetical protein